MKLIAVITIIFSSSAFSADFRTINFGDKCANVVELEAALGSQQIPLPVTYMFKFTGTHLARIGEISYSCDKDEILSSGSILFETETLDRAKALYGDLRQVLLSKYGTPSLDGSSEEYANFMKSIGSKVSNREKTQLSWSFGRFSIVFYMVFPESELNESSVVIIYAKNKEKQKSKK